jgi:hypothetical protein
MATIVRETEHAAARTIGHESEIEPHACEPACRLASGIMAAANYDAGIVWLRIGLQPKGAGHNQERQGQHTETHHPSTSWLDAEVNAAKYNPMWQTSPKEAKATGNPNRSTYIAAVSYVVGATGFEPVTSTV